MFLVPTDVPRTYWCSSYLLVFLVPTDVPRTYWCTSYLLPFLTGYFQIAMKDIGSRITNTIEYCYEPDIHNMVDYEKWI